MIAADLVDALQLPLRARVDQRVPKKLLVENGAPTAADKKRINDGIDEVQWLAALKPTTIAVPAFCDAMREYLEIAVLVVVLRPGAQGARLGALIHRAVPYPVFLIASEADGVGISLAHKRRSQGEAGATVLDGSPVGGELGAEGGGAIGEAFVNALALSRQPRTDLFALYHGWVDTVVALRAAQVTGVFAVASAPEQAEARWNALAECERLAAQMGGLRAAAKKERQISRQVDLNLELKRLQALELAARAKL